MTNLPRVGDDDFFGRFVARVLGNILDLVDDFHSFNDRSEHDLDGKS